MSEHSASPRLEALESSVSEIQERMSELVGMLRQLTTETRTAGDGRRGEESGGARRDAAHIYSSGARRGPLTAATGYRVTAVQDEGTGEATAARNFPVHHRAASEPADTRPGLPTGVGPMIDVRSGEARDPYLAGITAYDQGRDVLRAEFKSLPTRVVAPVLKAEKGSFQKFKHEFFLKTNMLDITDHFVGQGMRAVPVGDPLKQKAVLLQEGFSNEEIKGAYQAWNFIDAALQSDSDRSILKRCKSPREVFERLEKWHDPDSEVATQRLYDKFHEFTIPPHSDPIAALHDLEDINNQMHEKGIGRIPEAVLHEGFVRALPDEYSLVKETLQAMKNRDRDEIIRMVSTRHSNLPQKKGAQRSSRQPEQAFASNESGNRSGARRGRDRRNGGGQGRGRGGNSHGGVGNNNSSGTPSLSTSSPVETQGSSDGAGSLGGGGDGRHHIPSGRCFRCRQRGHRRQDCTTRESDFVPRCNRCTGYGHEESSCSSDAAILVVELPVPEEDLAVEAEAFAVSEAGKCSVTIGDAVGGVALDKQVVQYIADSAATCNMTPDADGLTNYRECSRPLGLANGEEISIVGYGDLTVNFRTDHRWVRVKMNDVAHVPQLSHNLISLPSMTLKGHTYMGDKGGVTLKLKGGETVFFPLIGKLCRQYGFRPEAAGSMVDSACTTIAPGKTKTPTPPTDINILHCTSGHTHEVLLKKEQQGVNPSGELHECRGCSMARGLRKSIARSTHTGADTLRLSRAPAAAAPYCQRGGVYSGGGRERGGGVKSRRKEGARRGVKSRRKEGARRGRRVQPRQRSGGVAPGVTRNARGASGRIRSRGSGGAEGNTPTPSASSGRGGASGRTRSRGSGGAEDDTPTPSASPRRGGASGRVRSRGSGGAEGNPPTPSASPGRGGASGRIRSRGSGGAEGDTPTPSAPLRRGGASGRICSRGHGGADGNPSTPAVSPGRGGASGKICSRGHGGADGNPSTPAVSPGRGGASGRICSRGHGGADGNPSTPAVSPGRGGASGRICSRGHGGADGNPSTPAVSPGRGDASGKICSRGHGGADGNPSTPAVSPGRGGASGKICSRGHGGAEGNPPTPSVPPGRADFGGINGNSSSYSSEDSRTSSDSSSGNDGGDFPTHARRPARDLEAFGELPVLQSGHTRSQSRGSAMGASCADDLLAYAMRAMEAEKPTEEKAAEVERAHDSLLEEQLEKEREWLEKLEGRGIGPRARDVRGCRVGRQGK